MALSRVETMRCLKPTVAARPPFPLRPGCTCHIFTQHAQTRQQACAAGASQDFRALGGWGRCGVPMCPHLHTPSRSCAPILTIGPRSVLLPAAAATDAQRAPVPQKATTEPQSLWRGLFPWAFGGRNQKPEGAGSPSRLWCLLVTGPSTPVPCS